ncbi:hypothetical protein A2316_02180 [Candidatus Falkowbacteria bacterium RIFOXYB2_FULL_38_15]|uniref:Uncharacterized protein n=1 Tax=Candidatus Falkowbacteria bacterium RIFOXYA2_FULL_38_12 TaxID=1797993 RepID=A0A1F5S3Y5_9BACT|nr:MAG: hypothetical protein A2257_00480 [Candidatus Falkowbacteria bacterium RIFOXYA2_FULL_38_12]OGF32617.1 MAG: hypothetical protein A2316_02180 [Candidatus Falkowbacteria bacterium RIFOXYB2_FULL_38_15]OGF44574.1 MAG: hypothetical protein A2555_00845 [Candidatus Falkowbacteria bacterium RIFOXYD2_FULL_39_16]
MRKIIGGPKNIYRFFIPRNGGLIFLMLEGGQCTFVLLNISRLKNENTVFFRGKMPGGEYVHGHFDCALQKGEMKEGYWGAKKPS